MDEAVVDLMTWVEAKANEKKIGTVDQKQPDPKKKQGWVPKYTSVGDILDLYEGPAEPDQPAVDMTEVAALVAAMTDATEPEF